MGISGLHERGDEPKEISCLIYTHTYTRKNPRERVAIVCLWVCAYVRILPACLSCKTACRLSGSARVWNSHASPISDQLELEHICYVCNSWVTLTLR